MMRLPSRTVTSPGYPTCFLTTSSTNVCMVSVLGWIANLTYGVRQMAHRGSGNGGLVAERALSLRRET